MTGIVIRVFGRYYTVKQDDVEYISVLRGRIKRTPEMRKFSNPVAVGDVVNFSINRDGLGVIESLVERKNFFSRKDKFKGKEDLIAANLDQVIAVQSFAVPRLNLRFVDRILVRGMSAGIPVVLCMNKLDIADKGDEAYISSYYRDSGLAIIFVSALTGEGIEKFRSMISGARSLLIGSSGVGKSSLLNEVFSGLSVKTAEVSESTGKGRHTTTNVQMEQINSSTELIDTPGVREFGIMHIEPHMLGTYFQDFNEASKKCRFNPCSHDHEPDCEVRRLVDLEEIHPDRYVSYLNILYSLRENIDNMY
ncbi:MAG: ribosome small subunit-dependent GTPase A [Spirochaetota bacterium]